ncbi:MAG: hypothetical protein WCV80_03500 [Candidatus Paceibacterota bacterium]|jgi:hypothetical protein
MKKYMFAFLVVGFVSSFGLVGIFAQSEDTSIRVHVYKGWNMLGNGDDYPKPLMEKAQYMFAYFPMLSRYVQIKPELPSEERDRISNEIKNVMGGTDLGRYEKHMKGSYWFYYPEEGDITLTVSAGRQQYLLPGWNFKFFSPEMLGHKFSEVTGDCNVQRAYIYASKQFSEGKDPWINLMSMDFGQITNSDSKQLLGYGILVKVEKECQLGVKNVVPNLPALPN